MIRTFPGFLLDHVLSGRDAARLDNWSVPDVPVALHAVEHLAAIADMGVKPGEELLMAADAIPLEDRGILRPNHDRLVKILEGETLRVPVSILRFRQIFSDEVVGRVTVVAGGNGVMGRLQPAVELFAHD